MSTITPGPIGPATSAKRGTQSAAHYTKLEALPANATLEARLVAIEAAEQAPVTLDGASSSWLTLVGQVLKLTLVSAAGVTAGLVDGAAQAWNGVKSFAAEAVFSAGLVATGVRAIGAALMLRSDLGAGASDVCNVFGTSVADGTVNAGAKLASFGTGIGGTYVEHLFIRKAAGSQAEIGYSNYSLIWDGDIFSITRAGEIYFRINAGVGTTFAGGTFLSFGGMFSQSGTDSTGTPGAATIAKPIGTSAIAAGQSSCVITNSLVAAGDWVMITPHARDATCKELIAVCTAGVITVSGSANATAALAFSWEVKKRI